MTPHPDVHRSQPLDLQRPPIRPDFAHPRALSDTMDPSLRLTYPTDNSFRPQYSNNSSNSVMSGYAAGRDVPPMSASPPVSRYNHVPDGQAHSGSSKSHGKRPAAQSDPRGSDETLGSSRSKRYKVDSDSDDGEDDDDVSPVPNSNQQQQAPQKVKATRGSRACTVCRRLKMKCVGAEQGPPCKRCIAGKHECIFEESNRGKRSSKKHEVLTKSLKKMEQTLETVMRSLNNPSVAAIVAANGGIPGLTDQDHPGSRSPSPSRALPTITNFGDSASSANDAHASPSGTHQSHQSMHSVHLTKKTENLTSRSTIAPSPRSPPRAGSTPSSGRLSSMRPPAPRAPSPALGSLPDNALNPLGLLAEASLANGNRGASDQALEARLVDRAVNGSIDEDGEPTGPNGVAQRPKVGVASASYFKPGPMNILSLRRLFIERQVQPEMLSFVSEEEVADLFQIYFDYMNIHCTLLDREFHTPSLVCSRSPFLLTVICAISSKFYNKKLELHPQLNRIAKKLSFNVPEKGYKSVEVVQAYLLLSLWGCGPVERFEQDKTWLLLGLAIRTATDLNLHRKSAGLPLSGPHAEWRARERELRNRERTWLLCFTLDRSFSAQMGKPHSINEDSIIRNSAVWWKLPETRPADRGLVGYCELQRIMSRSLDFLYSNTETASGLHTDADYLLIIKTIESQILSWRSQWDVELAVQNGDTDPSGFSEYEFGYAPLMLRFYFHYSMLVVNSFGLQNALEQSRVDLGHFFARCYSSAVACCLIVRDEMAPQGYLRYSPDSHSVLTSYAVLTLLKLIRPEFHVFMESEQRTLTLVKEMADTMESVAANPSHTPALYSSFLRAVASARTSPPETSPTSPRTNGETRPTTANGTGVTNDSPLDQTSGPAAGVYGDEHQFGDGALRLKMFPMPSLPQNEVSGGWSSGDMSAPGNDLDAFQLQQPEDFGVMSMDNILNGGFWDNVLIPGYSSGLEGLSGGFVYGTGASGFITPRRSSPAPDMHDGTDQQNTF